MAQVACKGFQWVGQPFTSCNQCGLPYWEHDFEERPKRDSGPFDDEPFDYIPITNEGKAKTRKHWTGE